jgi:sugar phosphate isomerase/epimerase
MHFLGVHGLSHSAGYAMKSINRRQFVRNAIGAGAGAALFSGSDSAMAFPPQSPPEPLKLSILSYSFHGLLQWGMMDIFGYLETCKYRYNLNAADIWNGFFPTLEEDFIQSVKRALDEREMILAQLCCEHCHIWTEDPDLRERNHKNALRHLDIGKTLGALTLRIDAGGFNYTKWPDEVFDHIVQRYKEYCQFAYDHGFILLTENHWGPEGTWSEMKRLFQAVDHPAFRICCHLGTWGVDADESWSADEDANRVADRESAPWISHTHIDWATCIDPDLLTERLGNLWSVGYEGYYSIEHHSGVNEYERVAIQLELVRNKLREFQQFGLKGYRADWRE